MNNKKYFLFWLLLFIGAASTSLVGQTTPAAEENKSWSFPYDAVIHMTDGMTVLNCSVIADKDNKLEVILSSSGDTLTLAYKDIKDCIRGSSSINAYKQQDINSERAAYSGTMKYRGSHTRRYGKLPIKALIRKTNWDLDEGTILEDDTYKLTILNAKGDTTTLNYNEVYKVIKKEEGARYYKDASYHYDKGIFVRFGMGGNTTFNNGYFTLEGILAKRINKKWAIGSGFSIDSYNLNLGELNTQSINLGNLFAYGRYNLTDTKARIFTSAKLGYGVSNLGENFRSEYSAGFNFSPSIGVIFSSKKRSRLTLETGISSQFVNGSYQDWIWTGADRQEVIGEYSSLMNRVFLKIGLDLK